MKNKLTAKQTVVLAGFLVENEGALSASALPRIAAVAQDKLGFTVTPANVRSLARQFELSLGVRKRAARPNSDSFLASRLVDVYEHIGLKVPLDLLAISKGHEGAGG